jgi:uncharacterized membrane protein YdcZ (DUF606 family)
VRRKHPPGANYLADHAGTRDRRAATVGLMLAAQLSIAAWLDHQGLLGVAVRPFDAGRLVGLALLIMGAWLVLRR